MQRLDLKTAHKPVAEYYRALAQFKHLRVEHEPAAARGQITNDPNRTDDPQYIVRLVGRDVRVSVETVRIVRALPGLGLGPSA